MVMLLTEGQASDHRGAALMLLQLPAGAREMIGDRGYDSARYRADLTARGITPCIHQRLAARCRSRTTRRSTAIALAATVTFWLSQ